MGRAIEMPDNDEVVALIAGLKLGLILDCSRMPKQGDGASIIKRMLAASAARSAPWRRCQSRFIVLIAQPARR